MFGPLPSGHIRICSVHHQYSGRVSPFHANTGTPAGLSTVPVGPTTVAAAAWSWVEKMLHEAQRTSAPNATSVSTNTAVCTVMWIEPVIRAPVSGLVTPNCSRIAISPGISCSASRISSRPKSARLRSATLKSGAPSAVKRLPLFGSVVVFAIETPHVCFSGYFPHPLHASRQQRWQELINWISTTNSRAPAAWFP